MSTAEVDSVDVAARRKLQAILGMLGAGVFFAIALYYATAADGHPRFKHMLLFIGLAAVSALVSWFSFPKKGSSPPAG